MYLCHTLHVSAVPSSRVSRRSYLPQNQNNNVQNGNAKSENAAPERDDTEAGGPGRH